jgi:hypothetical protein
MRSLPLPYSVKKVLFKIIEVFALPFTLVAAIEMRILRIYSLHHFPLSRWLLLRIGILPIRRHFYEPLFHPADLKRSLDAERSLPGIDFNGSGQLELLRQFHYADEITATFLASSPEQIWGRPLTPRYTVFGRGDLDYYYSLLRHFRPNRIIEIGAGYSTMAALAAVRQSRQEDAKYNCEITAIEPFPWFPDDGTIRLVRKLVEDVDTAIFSTLRANDILFIDSSHMIRPQGDVLFEFLQILPQLAPGVLVHVHDVFSPRDYPAMWVIDQHVLWNEQYLLEAFLTCNHEFKIIGALNWLQMHHPDALEEKCPTLRGHRDVRPHSFWMQRSASG